ncbi:MAG TPA: hypothetical protein VE959_05415 [Bryobacteraceae bacterium]|nr:hypothetical protein [Bryobacteraceae bacterium]
MPPIFVNLRMKERDALEETPDVIRCPNCGTRDVRHSHSRGVLDAIYAAFHRHPMRCRQCQKRFYLFYLNDPPDETPFRDADPESKTD